MQYALSLSSDTLTTRWMFEKYDGVRGFWNPVKRAFYSRKGKVLPFPKDITESMPGDVFLDGEIWYRLRCYGPSNTIPGLAEILFKRP